MSINSTGLGKDAPFVVGARQAQHLLDCGNTFFYELIKNREIVSYKSGKSRKVVVASISAYIDRRVAAERERIEGPPSAVGQQPIGHGCLRGGASDE